MIKNLLYILQSTSYSITSFLLFVYRNWQWWHMEKRQHIDWTYKTRMIYFLSWTLCIVCVTSFVYYLPFFTAFLCIILVIILLPFILLIALLLVTPVDFLIKKIIISKATRALEKCDVSIIAITGSYGKTSTKEIFYDILNEGFTVVKTPGNINTDIGVSRFIINNTEKLIDSDLFIVEMGADHRGDIATLCSIAPPDYSILTGINEAHIEKFGNIKNTIIEKFVLPQRTKKISFLNIDDYNIKQKHPSFDIAYPILLSHKHAKDINYKPDFNGISFTFKEEHFSTKLLAKHSIVPIIGAITLAKELGMQNTTLKKGLKNTAPFSHRLEPKYDEAGDYWIIDDSYNATIAGVKSGLDILQRSKGRRIVLTPGPLVESGSDTERLHMEIGRLYATLTDLVLLIKSPTTAFVIAGMKEKDFTNYRIYNSPTDAYNTYTNTLRAGDTILLQNDWPDVYF